MEREPPGCRIARTTVSKEVEADENTQDIKLTSANFAQLSGMKEMTETRLRTGQNRYLLHRAYASKVVHVL